MKDRFEFGSTIVEIRQGNIVKPGVELDAIASPDDNYLSMGLGLAGLLARLAGNDYRREAQLQGPIAVGSVVQTAPYGLRENGLDIRAVIHAASIDYDGNRVPLEQSVASATGSCLRHAERHGLRRILMPAFATGAGKLDMTAGARAMCGAIKEFLAVHRELDYVGIILYVPERKPGEPDDEYERRATAAAADNEPFLKTAGLILGTPYDPARPDPQIRDFHARDDELGRVLNDLKTGEARHVAVLGGPRMGKSALLAQVRNKCREIAAEGEQAPRLVPVTFGQVHENTPGSFIYRKMLLALADEESDADHVAVIRERYADPEMTWQVFAEFLEADPGRYSRVVFVIDDLPRLLAMDPRDATKERPAFWADLQDLGRLGGRIRLLFTATEDDSYAEVIARLEPGFTSALSEVRLGPIGNVGRERWAREALERYLHRQPTEDEIERIRDDLVEPEGGGHPFLIAVVIHTLIRELSGAALVGADSDAGYDSRTSRAIRAAVGQAVEGAQFFDDLLGRMGDAELLSVKRLAEYTALKAEEAKLTRRIGEGDAEAASRFAELQHRKRELLDLLDGRLDPLEKLGCTVGSQDPAGADFVSASTRRYMQEYSGVGVPGGRSDERVKVEIMVTRFDPTRIRVQLLGRGAHVFSTLKPLSEEDETLFRRDFDAFLNTSGEGKRAFRSINEIGNHVLTRFVSGGVKKHLIDAARRRTTIDFVVGRELEAIPWELIVETVYEDADELPFRMGRRVISGTEPAPIGEVQRGNGKIRALLIGNPTGDLAAAEDEVEAIREALLRDGRFEATLLGPGASSAGPASKRNVLRELAKQEYALIHYSGHSHQQREQSAWRLSEDGQIELLTTSDLTNFLQMAPPALVFSSSCESGKAEGEEHPIEYENQAFDLPGAVLQAGVQTYIGTLWNVADSSACAFSTRFYQALLEGTETLGECMRVAKNAVKEFEGESGVPTWPAFVLYGDPEITPEQVYPLLGEKGGTKS